MKVKELKRILKPLIKECVKEVLLEQNGALANIVTEVVAGLSNSQELIKEEREEKRIPAKKPFAVIKKKKLPNQESFTRLREEMLAKITGDNPANEEYEYLPDEDLPELPAAQTMTKRERKVEAFKEKQASLNESLNGFDPFEGTEPLDVEEKKAEKGVDLGIFENMASWKKIADAK